MLLSQIDPHIFSVGKSEWIWHSKKTNVSYCHRFMYINQNAAAVKLFNRQGDTLLDAVLDEGTILFWRSGILYLFSNVTQDYFNYICASYSYTQNQTQSSDIYFVSDFDWNDPCLSQDEKPDGMPDFVILPNNPAAQNICTRIWEEQFIRRPYYEEMCSGLMKALLSEAMRSQSASDNSVCKNTKLAETVMHYIDNRFHEPLTIQDIAKDLHYHPYYLTRIFTETYRITPYQYLKACRIRKAISLLKYTNYSISDITLQCGFTNQSHFSTAILKSTGKRPKDFR